MDGSARNSEGDDGRPDGTATHGDGPAAPPAVVAMELDGLTRFGIRSWAVVGIVVASVIVYLALAGLSGLVIPLVVAAVVGALCVPLVDRFSRHMPRKLAAAIVLVALVVVGIGAIAVAVAGIVDQAAEIREQLRSGLEAARVWLAGIGVDVGSVDGIMTGVGDFVGGSTGGLGSYVGSVFSSVSAFLAGTFVGLFLLFYILADWYEFSAWLGGHLAVPRALGAGIVEDATWSIRRYFYALTLTSLVTAVAIGVTAALIGAPLAVTIGLVTFITSYVPYVGAFVSGAFAVLIALGAGGVGAAAVLLLVILVVQMVVQPVLQNHMTASELDLNPAVSFGSTIVGGALAGVLGATLSAPVLAMLIKTVGRVREYHDDEEASTDP